VTSRGKKRIDGNTVGISRVNGRERNKDCDVIDRTRRQGDQKRF